MHCEQSIAFRERDASRAPPFVGRRVELAALQEAIAEARKGAPRVVLVQGEAGMGKSALLARMTAGLEAAGAVLLRGAGDEYESDLHLGLVGQLIAGIGAELESLPALARPEQNLDALAAGACLLELVGELQDLGPVVVVVDDAQWADSASLHALAFCLRRLRSDRVLALLTARAEHVDRLPRGLTALAQEPTGTTLSLAGLDAGELVQLADALGAGRLSLRAAGRLARHTGGSPLLAAALLTELGAVLLSSPEELEAHAPRSFASVVLARLSACGTPARELAVAGSVLGVRWPVALAVDLAGVEDELAALDEAIAAGLVVVERDQAGTLLGRFAHPLVQAAIYQELPLSRRARLHQAAATRVEDARAKLRHRAQARLGADPELALELLAEAERDEASGSWGAAARAHLWAARVAGSREERERRILDAAVCLLLAGDVAEARALLDSPSRFVDGAPLRFARGYLCWSDGDFGAAEPLLRSAWEMADAATDAELSARAADLLSSLCVYLGRGAEGIEWARRSLAVYPGSLPGANPRTSLLVGYGISRPAEEGLTEAARLDLQGDDAGLADGRVGRGTLRLWSDDPAGAREDLLPVVEHCLRNGPLDRAMFAAVHLADAEWRLGLWDQALVHAEAAVSAAAEAAHGWFLAEACAMAALPLTARGEWEAAEAQARAAVQAARRVGYGHGSLWAIVARARLAHARGEPDRVVHTLQPLLRFVAADGVDHPGLHPWRELLGLALLALGRTEEASEHAAALEDQAQRLARRSALARALRLRGLLEAAAGRQKGAVELLEHALTTLGPLPLPLDRALIEADLGACLRRVGHRRAAADRLRTADQTLARLGAAPFRARVARELSGCGLSPIRDALDARERLTATELAVARLVAEGRANREVAAELVLSAKTIEHHLGRIYQKLEIKSRTQLAAKLNATHDTG
jgi:DNA-binding CsgD family transcriptional regulator